MLFTLAAELRGHEADVKAVVPHGGSSLVSGSRDRAAIVWSPAEDGQRPPYRATFTYSMHEHYVNSLLSVGGKVASGSTDKTVRLWDVGSPDGAQVLRGHGDNVCALALAANGDLLTGACDHTARVWRGGELLHELKGHAANVWAVLGLPDGTVVTGSADKTLKLWTDGKCTKTLTGHTDAVRGLADVPGVGFLSCSNDGSLQLWSADGSALQKVKAHEHFVYAVSVLPSGEWATASEDKTVKIFRNGACVQTIAHPGTVWAVSSLPNGDLLTGCADGVARVWSTEAERAAPAEELELYSAALASQSVSSKQMDVELSESDLLLSPGAKDGEVICVRNEKGVVEAHQWSASDAVWVMVGVVTDGPSGADAGSAGGVLGGITYDRIFDVEVGQNTFKLGVNNGEDTYMAASRFLDDNDMDGNDLDRVQQIAEFIEQNMGSVTLGEQPAGPVGGDPFTGSGSYQVGGGADPNAVAHDQLHPFTTGGYSPSDGGAGGMGVSSSGPAVNPWLPGNRYVPGSGSAAAAGGAAAAPDPAAALPVLQFISFASGKADGIAKKLREFAAELQGTAHAITDQELAQIVSILYPATAAMPDDTIACILRCLSWPADKVFPVLDICRLLVVHPALGAAVDAAALGMLNEKVRASGSLEGPANRMLSMRWVANLFGVPGGTALVGAEASATIELAGAAAGGASKGERMAGLAVMLNFSIFFLENAREGLRQGMEPKLVAEAAREEKTLCISSLCEVLISGATDGAAQRTALGCVCNLLTGDASAQQLATDLEMPAAIDTIAAATADPATRALAAAIRALLS